MKEIEERIKRSEKYPLVTISSTGRLALKFPLDYSEEDKNKLRAWIREISDRIGIPEFSVRGRYSNIGYTSLTYGGHHGRNNKVLKYKISLDMEIEIFPTQYIGEEQ